MISIGGYEEHISLFSLELVIFWKPKDPKKGGLIKNWINQRLGVELIKQVDWEGKPFDKRLMANEIDLFIG